jgi:protein ImuB
MTTRLSDRQILCLWFPEWPIQRRLAAQPDLEHSVLLLTESTSRGEFVRHVNRRGERRGITAGMPVSEARTFIRPRDRCVCEPVHLEQDRQGLIELAIQAERFSFCVGLEDGEPPECLLLEVTGIAPLFGGEESLGRQIDEWASVQNLGGRIAIADTAGQAWAVAHLVSQHRRPSILSAEDRKVLEALPLVALRLNEATVSKLQRLGLETVSQLLALDRPALLRRFGEELLRRLDQFTGQRPELIAPCRPQPRYRVERRLEEGIGHPEAIEHLSSSLLEQLLKQLQPWRLGLRHLRGELRLEDRTVQEIDLRVCQATHDRRHLEDLLRFQWERASLTAPLMSLSWEALEVTPLDAAQGELFDQASRDQARQYAMLINRLVSRLGEEAVAAPQLLPDPVPERSVRRCPITQTTGETLSPQPARRCHALDRPPLLFNKPRPIEVIVVAPEGPPRMILWTLSAGRSAAPGGRSESNRGGGRTSSSAVITTARRRRWGGVCGSFVACRTGAGSGTGSGERWLMPNSTV